MSAQRAGEAIDLRVAGMSKLSSVDWPDKLVTTVFLQGCPWDCFYCHNPALIDPRAAGALGWSAVWQHLERRVGLLDGVVFTGGEATMQHELLPAVAAARSLGFGVGLHTGGAYPGRLAALLPLLDWIGFDIKATASRYEKVVGRPGSSEKAWHSLDLVLDEQQRRAGTAAPLDLEVRTTVHSEAVDEQGLAELSARLSDAGVRTWALQRFRDTGTRDVLPRVTAPGRRIDLGAAPTDRFERVIVR
ncbi:anaerobic ribonucleoside-triphosphate reductase activating protein [Microbacterium sp. H1-D42]|uniref:anaerobic ribonucleoside-triphosphate reductase activating protein n=1 Tax=Microbacterium sp. H1-D42 TaxID=2925844 RepID=UPI001F52B88A|nr:anaerobic ribonucleoside-triphosphate reductase activating protein [Microbacterium sp. H1-D42]UNK69838.1 anaerobic ribonucleoside-triphosphate reductase activating protein [Microbacterium sp. H1-D42]